MKIKKIGHCCLLIEINGVKILTDPGAYSSGQENILDINAVLITHEHNDHLHIDSLKAIIKNNPNIKILTNSGVAKKLTEAAIAYELLEGPNKMEIEKILIEAFEFKHEEVFEEIGQVQNTGYFIANRLFYPGDSFGNPERRVEILALPVAGPWCKIADAVRYALKINPKKTFPIHDGMLQKERIGAAHKIPEIVLKEHGIEFIPMIDNSEIEID